MIYRNLGNTGLKVSEVGMGCNRLGESNQPDKHWIGLVESAVELGVNVFDTSESYGRGRSEEILGYAIGNRDDVYIATKMSHLRGADKSDFSTKRMMENIEGSLKRLKRACITIYQLHSPSRQDMENYDWADGMAQLKKQGKIMVSAMAVNSVADGIWLIEQGLIEALQITYNIFETEAGDRLFDLAEKNKVGLLCRMPLARGVLTGKFHIGQEIADGYRASLDGQRATKRVEMIEALRPIADKYEGGMTRMALHFSLTPKSISAIIPGARRIDQLEENVQSSNGTGLSEDIHREIKQIQEKWVY